MFLDRTNLQSWRSQIGYIPQQVYLFDETIKEGAEELIRKAREEGLIITPKVSPNDKRMASKWEKHQEYSKQTSRENLRTEPRHQSEK